MTPLITQDLLDTSYQYSDYRTLITTLLDKGKTTGPYDSQEMLDYTHLNLKRMDKWDKIGKITPPLESVIKTIEQPLIWLVLTEGWCGDAAQSLPFLQKMAEVNPRISLKLILRDQNLELMDAYRTDGGRSIPKLIALDVELNELGTWGPRPQPMQQLMLANKKTQAKSYHALAAEMHLWYSKDRGRTLQEEFLERLPQWIKKLQQV